MFDDSIIELSNTLFPKLKKPKQKNFKDYYLQKNNKQKDCLFKNKLKRRSFLFANINLSCRASFEKNKNFLKNLVIKSEKSKQ